MYWISLALAMQVLWRAAVLDRDGHAVGGDEHLLRMPPALAGAERVAFEFAGVDDLRGDVLGGDGRTEQMGDAATGGKGGGER